MGKAVASEGNAQAGWWGDLREVMNVEQAARYLGVSPDTLYKYLSEGKVPAFKLGNRWRIRLEDAERWFDEHVPQDDSSKSAHKTVTIRHGSLRRLAASDREGVT